MDESDCKSSFAPPSVIWNGAMEQVYIGGRQFQQWAWSIFGLKKNSNDFLSVKGSRHFPRGLFLSEQS
jgi:hypothetical protein